MIRRILLLLAAAVLPLTALHAAGLVISKSSAVVADAVSTLNPKALPGAMVDYTLLVDNANAALSGQAIRQVVITDQISDKAALRVADYGATGSGPVEFADGSLLGTGLIGSGVSLSFKGLADTTDGIEFSDGTSWSYKPVASADGYDPKVRAIRLTFTGAQVAASRFRLRYRVTLK